MTVRDVFLIDGARTPFLKVRGKRGPFTPVDLAVQCGRPLLARQPMASDAFDMVILGCVNVIADEMNPARVAALRMGMGEGMVAFTVQINCGSGMQSIDTAFRCIREGQSDLILAGGTEALSHAPLVLRDEAVDWLAGMQTASGPLETAQSAMQIRPKDLKPVVGLERGLTDPITDLGMGQTAELLAHHFRITRAMADAYAVDSHSRDFHARLQALSDADKAPRIAMVPVSFTNALYGDETAKRAARRDARFVNSAMMVTLLGAVVSDATENGQVVSGVGGQVNFVEQAFALRGARSVITLPATRSGKGGTTSNIRWSYGHVTVPRHMRDIVVTEYGIADLRGKSDADTIAALLAIADSRFQNDLAEQAKAAGKLPKDHRLPAGARQNTPEALKAWLDPHRDDALPSFPFGTDFTEVEQRLLPALGDLRAASGSLPALAALVLRGLRGAAAPREHEALERLSLTAPGPFKARLTALAVRGALRRNA